MMVTTNRMNTSWKSLLFFDPLPAFLDRRDPALTYFVERDLLEKMVGPIEGLWNLPEPTRLIAKQQANGAWHYAGRSNHRSASQRDVGTTDPQLWDQRHPAGSKTHP
jgi:hypothetical protein